MAAFHAPEWVATMLAARDASPVPSNPAIAHAALAARELLADVQVALDRKLAHAARHGDDGYEVAQLGRELEQCDADERRLEAWARRDDGTPNPFKPALDVWTLAMLRNGLEAQLGKVRARIQQRVARAEMTL